LGDRYLLCSDGLTDMVAEDRIAEVLAEPAPEAVVAQLVEDALLAGGVDNVTCLVFDVVDGPRVSGDGRLFGAVFDPKNIVDSGVVRSG
jgi:serine/threonine protein phosphatase PrpC